jgi:hypothetical protein
MLQVQPKPWGAVQVGVDGVWLAADGFGDGRVAPDTGGTALYAAIGLLGRVRTDLLRRALVDVPAVLVLDGQQTVGAQVSLSLSYDFREIREPNRGWRVGLRVWVRMRLR